MKRSVIVSLSALGTLLSVLLFREDTELLTSLTGLLSLIILLSNFSIARALFYFLILIIAFLSEIAFVALGAWSYPYETAFGIPFWMPFVWINSLFFFMQLKESIDRKLRTKSS